MQIVRNSYGSNGISSIQDDDIPQIANVLQKALPRANNNSRIDNFTGKNSSPVKSGSFH